MICNSCSSCSSASAWERVRSGSTAAAARPALSCPQPAAGPCVLQSINCPFPILALIKKWGAAAGATSSEIVVPQLLQVPDAMLVLPWEKKRDQGRRRLALAGTLPPPAPQEEALRLAAAGALGGWHHLAGLGPCSCCCAGCPMSRIYHDAADHAVLCVRPQLVRLARRTLSWAIAAARLPGCCRPAGFFRGTSYCFGYHHGLARCSRSWLAHMSLRRNMSSVADVGERQAVESGLPCSLPLGADARRLVLAGTSTLRASLRRGRGLTWRRPDQRLRRGQQG
jgi:hypothetical protein